MGDNPVKIAQIINATKVVNINTNADIGIFNTQKEAEIKAKQVARGDQQDAAIIKEGNKFRVYGIDEVQIKLKEAGNYGKIKENIKLFEIVATDPATKDEVILQKDSEPDLTQGDADLDVTKYSKRFEKELQKTLGEKYAPELEELKTLERKIESEHGINIKIQLSDDVFESKDKIEGFKYFLNFVYQNADEFKVRNIRTINVADEWDHWFGYKIDLDYEKKKGRVFSLGDKFLNDWGKSSKVEGEYGNKVKESLGEKLNPQELIHRAEIFDNIKQNFQKVLVQMGELQGNIDNPNINLKEKTEITAKTLNEINDLIQKAKPELKKISVEQEKTLSLDALEKFEQTYKDLDREVKLLNEELKKPQPDQLSLKARTEKIKLSLFKNPQATGFNPNYLWTYVSAGAEAIPPSFGLIYGRAFGRGGGTAGYINLGHPGQGGADNILLGLGAAHQINSNKPALDGTIASVGFGTGINSPLFLGINVNNSWYIGDYKGPDKVSAVGGLYGTLGTYNNVGGWIDVNKKINSRIEVEQTMDLSLLNQTIEAEVELALTKNKGVYLIGGLSTNKLLYGGIGFSDAYELKAGLGGISFGKDSNNLPGETAWEIGLRTYLPILPYFKYHRVPGYNFAYKDDSKEYISNTGTFISEKTVDKKTTRTTFIPSPAKDEKKSLNPTFIKGSNFNPPLQKGDIGGLDEKTIAYRIIKNKDDLKNIAKALIREVSINELGYVSVKDGEQVIVKDGVPMANLTEAETGTIADQVGILWYDKMKKGKDKQSISIRREDIPLPIFRV